MDAITLVMGQRGLSLTKNNENSWRFYEIIYIKNPDSMYGTIYRNRLFKTYE
ncbi:MAG: hypothetical protein Kow00102_06420 [Spirochaetota bacterium]